jgi:hypothetical protein
MLDDQEFLVLRTVKKGERSVQDITEQTGLPISVVRTKIRVLKARLYGGENPLVEEDNGNLSTRF